MLSLFSRRKTPWQLKLRRKTRNYNNIVRSNGALSWAKSGEFTRSTAAVSLVTVPVVTVPLVTAPLVTVSLVTVPLVTVPLVTVSLVAVSLVTVSLVTVPLVAVPEALPPCLMPSLPRARSRSSCTRITSRTRYRARAHAKIRKLVTHAPLFTIIWLLCKENGVIYQRWEYLLASDGVGLTHEPTQ